MIFVDNVCIPGEKIWVDDLRPAPDGFRWCKTYKQAIATIKYFARTEAGIDLICFDHDLGEEKSGYDVAKYIVENHISVETYMIQSMNPVGAQNIRELLNHYGYTELQREHD